MLSVPCESRTRTPVRSSPLRGSCWWWLQPPSSRKSSSKKEVGGDRLLCCCLHPYRASLVLVRPFATFLLRCAVRVGGGSQAAAVIANRGRRRRRAVIVCRTVPRAILRSRADRVGRIGLQAPGSTHRVRISASCGDGVAPSRPSKKIAVSNNINNINNTHTHTHHTRTHTRARGYP